MLAQITTSTPKTLLLHVLRQQITYQHRFRLDKEKQHKTVEKNDEICKNLGSGTDFNNE